MDPVLLATLEGAAAGGIIGSVSAHILARRSQTREHRRAAKTIGSCLYLEAEKMWTVVVYCRDSQRFWHYLEFDTAFHDAFPRYAHLFDARTAFAVVGAQQTARWMMRVRKRRAPSDPIPESMDVTLNALEAKLKLELQELERCGVTTEDRSGYHEVMEQFYSKPRRDTEAALAMAAERSEDTEGESQQS